MTFLAIACCLLVSFIYTGIEAGLLSLNPARLHGRVRAGERAAARLERLLAHPGRVLATVLLVTNFADVAALILVTDALVRRFGSPEGYAIAFVALLPLYLLGVQVLPRFMFRRFPYRALAALAGLMEVTSRVLGPVLRLGVGLTQTLNWSKSGPARSVFVAREELKTLAVEGERTGALSSAERGMIHTVVDFRAVRARDVMRPLPAPFLAAPGQGARVAALLADARARCLECLPVVAADRPGEILGLFDVFNLLLERDLQRDLLALGTNRRPPVLVRPDDLAYGIIGRLRTARSRYAAVVADGRPIGLVRSRDLIERLVRGAAK